jgi:hypothetical protein
MMFCTFFICVGLALTANRLVFGNRAEFIGLSAVGEKQGETQEAMPAA